MKNEEGHVCGECSYFSSVHPYKEGVCLKQVTKDARKGKLVFQKVELREEACENFEFYHNIKDGEGK
jgi:hypothetical protein